MAAPDPSPGVNTILRTRAYCVQGNQTSINIRYWQVLSLTTGGARLSEIAGAMDAQFAPAYKNMLVAAASYHGWDVAQFSPGPPGIAQISNLAAGPGTIPGNAAPLQVCGIITVNTAQIGRAYRGRIYTPFLAASSVDPNGQATVAYQNLLTQLANDYTGSVVVVGVNGTSNLSPVIWHKKTSTWTQVTHFMVRSKLGTQRRRGAYGRPNFAPF